MKFLVVTPPSIYHIIPMLMQDRQEAVLQRSLFYSLSEQSGVDTHISQPTCHQHDLLQTYRDVSSTYPLPFSFDVNITNTCYSSKS